MLSETLERENRQRRIYVADSSAQQISGAPFTTRSERMVAHEKGDVALKSLRKRKIHLTARLLFKQLLFRVWHDADNLDRLFAGLAAEIATHSHPSTFALP